MINTAEELLKIKTPEKLFPNTVTEAQKKYRELARKWHPDVNGGSGEVFQHVVVLYEKVLRKIEDGAWGVAGRLHVARKSDPSTGWSLRYRSHHRFELGDFYVGDNAVVYLVDRAHKALFDNAVTRMKSFQFASTKMSEEVARYLPVHFETMDTNDGRLALFTSKSPDLLLLRDVLDYYKGSVDPRHVAWIQSTLHNLSCYLGPYAGITHNDISPDTYFISPEYHSGALLGGWWYSAMAGANLRQVPSRTFDYLPWKARSKKIATRLTDLELIRATGRELLGDITGTKLSKANAPEPMIKRLKSVASGNAVDDYREWGEVLTASFGAKRFTKMELNADKIYQGGNLWE